MVKPVNPQEALALKQNLMPDYVIEAFNEVIAEKLDAYMRSQFTQKEVVARILSKAPKDAEGDPMISSAEIYRGKWLDVEQLYIQQGWVVRYDKPAYNESYDAFFVFEQKR